MAASNRSLSLDGIRGLALGAPIMLHLGLYGAGNGAWLSIAMFFTLSGFLITTLALKEIDRTGRLSIKAFYARRLRRLMPAALLVLTLTVVFASALDWPLMSAVRRDVFAALTWTANWEQLGGAGYWETTVPSLTLHFWSLSLEEQIYVVFPLVVALAVVLFTRRSQPVIRIAWVMGLITVVSWVLLCVGDDPSNIYLSTFTRMGEAAYGCFIAALSHRLPTKRTDKQASIITIGLILLVAPLWVISAANEAWGVRLGILAGTPPTGVVIAMLWRYPGSLASRFFSLRIPAWLGRRSYGIYLVHLPLIDLLAYRLHTDHLSVPWMLVAVAATIVLAGLLFAYVEEPIRVGKVVVGPTRFAALIATSVLVLAGLNVQLTSGGASALQLPDNNQTPLVSGDVTFTLPPSTVAGDPARVFTNPPPPSAPARVLVIGDSTAWVTAGAVESLEQQGWVVDAMWMVNCPIGGDARVMATETAEAVQPRELGELPGCDQWWNEYLPEALLAFEPTMVVLVGGYVLAYEIDPEGDDRWCHLGDGSDRCEPWAAARLRATTERVHTYAPDAHLVIATGGYVDPWGPQNIERPTIDVLNELIRAEARRDGASLIDLGSWLNDHLELLYDGIHLGTQGIDALKPWISEELEAVAAGQRLTR